MKKNKKVKKKINYKNLIVQKIKALKKKIKKYRIKNILIKIKSFMIIKNKYKAMSHHKMNSKFYNKKIKTYLIFQSIKHKNFNQENHKTIKQTQ